MNPIQLKRCLREMGIQAKEPELRARLSGRTQRLWKCTEARLARPYKPWKRIWVLSQVSWDSYILTVSVRCEL